MGIRASFISTMSWPQGCEAEDQAVERGCPVWRLRTLAALPALSPHCHPRIGDYDGNTHTHSTPTPHPAITESFLTDDKGSERLTTALTDTWIRTPH